MILYGSILSPFVRKVAAFAAEKGIALEIKTIGLNSEDPEFRAASPLGKIPGFADGDFTLSDSTAICTYLEALQPAPALIPAEPKARAMAVWWDEFADTELAAAGVPMFFNRIVAPLFMRQPGDPDAADRAEREALPRLLDHLERAVPAEGFLVGDAVTLADLAVGSVLVNLDHAGAPLGRYPAVVAYAARIHARASFAGVARERAAIAKARAAA